MNKFAVSEEIKIDDLIYEVRGKQVMLDSDVSVTKCNGNMAIHLWYWKISSCNYNFADVSAKLLR